MTPSIRLQSFFLIVFFIFISATSFAQCLQIETILVDACDDSGDEGFNEMVRFKTGATAVNLGVINVNWPAQSWQGLLQNAFTASKVATLNTQIASLGGCGRLLEPVLGVIPANTKVILITSQNFSLTANAFGALTQDVYILFQDNPTVTGGHFGNYNATSGIRTLTISFGACSGTVSYDRSLLVDANGLPGASNGATVNFSSTGVASYTNGGCVAPIDVFSVEAGNPLAACPGATVALLGTAQGQNLVAWSASSGLFSNSSALSTNFTLPFSASGSIVLTLTVTNICGNSISDTVTITVNPTTTPNFSPTIAFCSGSVAPTLNTTSPNGIVGTWSPSVINNTVGNAYTFTPNTGQCATSFVTTVTVNPATTPDFSATLTLCSGNVAPVLNTTSPNGIVGTWSPSIINNTVGGNYIFTPNTGQCASNFTMVVTVTSASLIPNFAATLSLCSGTTAPVLNNTSPNGIVGTWSPSIINNTVGGNYVFTPNAGQCASNFTTVVTVTSANIIPDFAPTLTLCSGNVAPILNTTSPSGIVGTWSPSIINNTVGGNYIFTPNAGQCATNFTTVVTVTSANIIPDFAPTLTLCSGNVAPVLNTTSPNGIVGTWSPSIINNTIGGNYVFTPNAGQCASNFTTVVTVTSANIIPDFLPTLTLCSGNIAPVLNTTSPSGIVGTWSPSTINNTVGGNYVFTPNAGQCATNFTTVVTVTSANIIPDFAPTLTLCSGNVAPVLNATSPNGIVGTWSPSIINNTVGGNYVFTPNAGQCATNFTTVVTVTSANIIPSFAPTLSLCNGTTAPVLNATSPNGIVGTWSPSTINNNVGGNYVFTPNAGQCATNFTTVVTVTSANIIPSFAPTLSLCTGTTAPVLSATSPNGIVGTWSPSIISNTVGGNYIFTPNAGQCATNFTTVVSITAPNIIPTFNSISPICNGDALAPLPLTSINGITGTWSPALDNTQTKTYTFTPNAGQCAVNTQLIITVNAPSIVPVFATTTLTICNGDALIPLPTTSINGIVGSWSPALDNTQTKTYNFIPNPGQCALGTTFTITVTPKIVPTFNPVNATCVGETLSPLPIASLNGIVGSWSPALDNTQTRTYTFTPNPNQCATTASLTITINAAITPLFNLIAPVCEGTSINPLPPTSLNGIVGTWSPVFDNTTSQLYTFTPNTGQCATNGNLNITVASNPILFENGYICFDSLGQLVTPATIDIGLSSADYTFVWTQDGNPNPITNTSSSYQATQAGIYKVTATNILTNCSITLVTTVDASPAATAIAYVNEDFADVQQIIVKVTGGLGNFLYQLNNGPWQSSNTFIITQGGDYTIHVEDLNGCNTFELEVTALNYPKFFTPNGDGYNDFWNVDGLLPSQNGIITIFDRYGKLLKQISANGEGWNGNYNGSTLPATDYWFVISYESLSGASKSFRAHFSLKR